jgi:hypothetical protein
MLMLKHNKADDIRVMYPHMLGTLSYNKVAICHKALSTCTRQPH